MADKYDEHVQQLTDDPDLIQFHWSRSKGIFGFCTMDRSTSAANGARCGCLTMVRQGKYVAETPELTDAIRADKRIPADPEDIKPEHLPVFAEWQRRLDLELNRV